FTERRRSTLTSRLPLLRKASREVPSPSAAPVPSAHLRGPSTSTRLSSPNSSPFWATGAPRGRYQQSSEELSQRDPSIDNTIRSQHDSAADNASEKSTTLRNAPSLASIRNTTAGAEERRNSGQATSQLEQGLQPSRRRRNDRKMHQTSSR